MNGWEWFVTAGATCGIAAFMIVIWLLAACLAAIAGQATPEPLDADQHLEDAVP